MRFKVVGILTSLVLFCTSLLAVGRPIVDVTSQVPFQEARVRIFTNELHYHDLPMVSYWKITVLDKENWEEAVVKFKANTVTAFTLPHLDQTFLNGPWLQRVNEYDARHTIAHEAGHLICRCGSETEANKIADKLLK